MKKYVITGIAVVAVVIVGITLAVSKTIRSRDI